MTYRQQMEKSIKGYMASVGFKYYAPQYIYIKWIDKDTVATIGYATYNGGQKEYYQLSIYVSLIYRTWNNLLYQLTEGFCDYDSCTNGPIFFPTRLDWNENVEFTGTRPMEENLEAFKTELETRAFPMLERYQDRNLLYQDMLEHKNECYYKKNFNWYMPIAHYVNGNHQEALRFVENVLKECEQNYKKNPDAPRYIKDLRDFRLYHKNLKRLIKGEGLPPRSTPSVITQILEKLYKTQK